jgi:hypothetical protein
VRGFFQAKALHFDAKDDDAFGCHNPLEGAIVATFVPLGLRLKTLDLVVSTTVPCALLSSWGRRSGASVLLGLLAFSYLFFIYFLRGSPHYLVSVWPFVALFIKRGKSLFRGGSLHNEDIGKKYGF